MQIIDPKTQKFISKAKAVHEEQYDYSKSKYIAASASLTIICSKHGDFSQAPSKHLMGRGCPKCGRLKAASKMSAGLDNFIYKAKKRHGDKYNYQHVEYINSHTKIAISCREHGEFYQMPAKHLSGQGCPSCGRTKSDEKRKGTLKSLIAKSRKLHGEKYDFSKFEYIDAITPGEIQCPIHGSFFYSPSYHLSTIGCPKCGRAQQAKSKTYDRNEVIQRFKEKHGDKFDYSKFKYTNMEKRSRIICPDHGLFLSSATEHLRGFGCSKCGLIQRAEDQKKPLEELISECKAVHGELYDYELYDPPSHHSKGKIRCAIHGYFFQAPGVHLAGSGCPKCAKYGFNPAKPAILYYLEIKKKGIKAWKIGLTNRTVEDRFRKDMAYISIIDIHKFEDGQKAWDLEQFILTKYRPNHGWGTNAPLLESGNSELFKTDILAGKTLRKLAEGLTKS
jgi:hypothetical protein